MAEEKTTTETVVDQKDTKEKIEVSKESQTIIESIEKMTVLDLSKLVKALEDKFGVVAAAPVAVAAASGASADADEDSGPSTVSVILTSCGDKKIQVLKEENQLLIMALNNKNIQSFKRNGKKEVSLLKKVDCKLKM